jgi:hypothetical protein
MTISSNDSYSKSSENFYNSHSLKPKNKNVVKGVERNKSYISGSLKINKIRGQSEKLSRYEIWSKTVRFSEDNNLFSLKSLWLEEKFGTDYFSNSLLCVLAESYPYRTNRDIKQIHLPFQWVNIISLSADIENSAIKQLLADAITENIQSFLNGLHQCIVEIINSNGPTEKRLERVKETLLFLQETTPEAYYRSLKVVHHLQAHVPNLLNLHINQQTLAEELKSISNHSQTVPSEEDKAYNLRRKVLSKLDLSTKIPYMIDEKLIGIILGDSLVNNSSLEGYNYSRAIQIFLSFDKQLGPQLTEELKQMYNWSTKSSADSDALLANMAQRLKEKGRITVPAGWCNYNSGHAMVIEAVLNDDHKATVRIYNQGAGIDNHCAIQGSFRERKAAYLEKTEIPKELVLSPAFWGIMTEMRRSKSSINEPYHSGDIYDWFIHCIPGKIGNGDQFILPQRAGSCTIKSVLAYLKKQMSEVDYDNFILRFKFGVLLSYEESLCFRRGSIDLAQKRFLREVRQKLLESTRVQRKVGRIDKKTATLLETYCKVDIQLDEDKSFNTKLQQLTSTFGLDAPSFINYSKYDLLRDPVKNHNRSYKHFSFTKSFHWHSSLPETKNRLQLLMENAVSDLNWEEEEFDGLVALTRLLPSIQNIASTSESGAILTTDIFDKYSIILRWIEKLKRECSSLNSGVKGQIMYAWAIEWVTALIEAEICKQTPENDLVEGRLPYTLSPPAGAHPLEKKGALFDNHSHLLDSESEGLLTQWLQRRVYTKEKQSVFTVSKILNLSNGNKTVALCGNFKMNSAFTRWMDQLGQAVQEGYRPSDYLRNNSNNGYLHFLLSCTKFHPIKVKERELHRIIQKLILDFCRHSSGFMVESTNLLGKHLTNKPNSIIYGARGEMGCKTIYRHVPVQKTLAPQCLPHIGIDLQLNEIEEDHEKLLLYQPEKSWFQLSLSMDNNTRGSGVPCSEGVKTGFSPFTIALKQGTFSKFSPRLIQIAEKIISQSPRQTKLCISILTLLAQINLRLNENERLNLNLEPEKISDLYKNEELALRLVQYQLTLSPKHVGDEKYLTAAYYLHLRNGLEQHKAFTQENQVFYNDSLVSALEENLGKKTTQSCWEKAQNIPGAKKGKYSIDKTCNVPVLKGISQFRNREWKTSGSGKILYQCLGDLPFGEWKLETKPGTNEQAILREWSQTNPPYHVKEFSRKYNGNYYFAINGSVMKERLSQLKIALSPKFEPLLDTSTYFISGESSSLSNIPDALRKDHVELWWAADMLGHKKGVLIDPKQRRVYLLTQTNAKNELRVKIIDCQRDAELLAGKLIFSQKLYLKWCNQVLRIPHLGDTGSHIPVEVWAKGRGGKNMQLWLNCLGGALRFKITGDKGKKKTYWSEDYEGFCWDSEAWVPELGKLNGLILTKDREQILILPKQIPKRSSKDVYRHIWKTIDTENPYILRRTLHKDLDATDSDQRLFSTHRSEVYPTIIRELMLQRDWDRAKQYVSLLRPGSALDCSFQQELKEKPLSRMNLDHPKARVLRLRILTVCTLEITSGLLLNLGYSPALLKCDYLRYIEQYPHLTDGWALSKNEEKKLFNYFLHLNQIGSMIVNHQKRISGHKPVKLFEIKQGNIDELSSVNQVSNSNSCFWSHLYRPNGIATRYHSGLLRLNKESDNACWRLLSTALLWNSCRSNTNKRLSIAQYIQSALTETALLHREKNNTNWSFKPQKKVLERILKREDLKAITQPSVKECLSALQMRNFKTQSSSSNSQSNCLNILQDNGIADMLDDSFSDFVNTLDCEDKLSKRQKLRENEVLGRCILPHDEAYKRIDRSMMVHKNSDQVKKRKLSSGSHLEYDNKRQCTSSSSNNSRSMLAKEAFPDLVHTQKHPQELEKIHANKKQIQQDLLKAIQEKNSKNFSLVELYQWLEQQKLELNPNSPGAHMADLLISYSQSCSEILALERTIKLLSTELNASKFAIQRSLSCADTQSYPMETYLRYRLAAMVWRRKIALRPKQLEVSIQMLKRDGCLASVDCGGGKTAIISPLYSSLEDNLVLNLVPPGVIDKHSEALTLNSESSHATTVHRVELTRSNVFNKLSEFEALMKSARDERSPLIATVSDFSSLALAYFESLLPDSPHAADQYRLETIIKTFKKSTTLLLDEVDTAAKEQVHWTQGYEEPISFITTTICSIVYDSLLQLVSQREGGLQSLMGMQFSQENYNKVLVSLVNELVDGDKLPLHSSNIDKKWIKEYLLAERGGGENVGLEKGLENRSIRAINAIRTLRAILKTYLPYALAMRYRVEYGPDMTGNSVIPYLAANQPDPKCRFTIKEVTALLTIQLGLQEAPAVDDVLEFLGNALKRNSTTSVKRWLGPQTKLSEVRDILEKKGSWKQGMARLQKSPFLRLDLVVKNRLPKIKQHTRLLQFTVATLEHLMNRVVGLTATPFNKDGMDPRMAKHYIPSESIATTKDLLKKCQFSHCPSLREMDKFLSSIAKPEGVHGLIDPAALLVEYSNERLSSLILKKASKNIHHVISWDTEKAEWRAWNRYGANERYQSSKHQSKNCFFVYDQARSRGMDLPLPHSCKVKVLVGEQCSFSDVKQAVERCRQAKSGSQKVEIFVPSSWETKADKVIELTERNQRSQLRELLPLMTRRQLFEICRSRFLQKVWDDQCTTEEYTDLLIQKMDSDTSLKLASLKPAPTIKEDLKAYMELLVSKYSDKLLTYSDIEAMKAAVTRCLTALDRDKNETISPTLDLRVQAIQSANAQKQQQAQARVRLEKAKRLSVLTKLWSASDVLTELASNGLPGKQNVSWYKFQYKGGVQFTALRISLLLAHKSISSNFWLSSQILSPESSKIIPSLNALTEGVQSSCRKIIWKRMKMAEYILSVPKKLQQDADQMLLLTAEEANKVVFSLGKLKSTSLTLYRADGTSIYPSNAANLPSLICIITALINGRGRKLNPSEIEKLVARDHSSDCWEAYLKQRLSQYSFGSSLSFEKNPVVKAVKQAKTFSLNSSSSSSSSSWS